MYNLNEAYIAYIMPYKCDTYSLIVEGTNGYHDLDASGHFCSVPIRLDRPNQINITTQAVSHNDNFTAIPFCIYQVTRNIKIFSMAGIENNVITQQCAEWLGPTSKIDVTVDVQYDEHKTYLQGNPHPLKIYRPSFEYKPNTWFVGLKTSQFHTTKYQAYHPLTYRICNNLEVFHHGNNQMYNFIKADEKMFSYKRVLFYHKIDTVWDWLYCVRMLKFCFWGTHMHPRPADWPIEHGEDFPSTQATYK